MLWLLGHWPVLVLVAGAAVCVWLWPIVGPVVTLALRWLLGTETGRFVLVAGLVVGCLCWIWTARYADGYAAAMADEARKAESAARKAQAQAVKRDEQSDKATAAVRTAADARATEHETRAARVEGIAHAERPAVPVVCPGPDPDLYHELQDGAGRVRAAEDRLRRYGPAAGAPAK